MISYLGSLVQFSPAAGRAGRCRQKSLCVGSSRRVLAKQLQFWGPLPGCGVPFPSAASGPGSQRLGAPSWAPRAPSLRGLSAPPSGLTPGVFRQDPGPVCRVGGGGFSGAEFAPFPSPLPPSSSGVGAALLWSFSVPLFCQPPAVCSGQLIFPSLSHSLKKSPSDCSQGLLAGPHPKQCCRFLSVQPPLAGGGCGRLGYFSNGSCF